VRKGRIKNPGFEMLRAIAKAMSFPPEVEFEESVGKAYRFAIQVGKRCASVVSATTARTSCSSSSP
jgi:hypothetical protein